jgi:hypothetical protein
MMFVDRKIGNGAVAKVFGDYVAARMVLLH